MTDLPPAEDVALVRLSSDEAVVLFELLSRWSDAREGSTPSGECFRSDAEMAVLNNILADLEGQLAAPFRSNYAEILKGCLKAACSSMGLPHAQRLNLRIGWRAGILTL